jgi:hypothetical protein
VAIQPNRIHEIDIAVPALRLLAAQPNGTLRTSELRRLLENLFQIKGADAQPIAGSGGAPLFSQIARNIVSNRRGGSNIVFRHFANFFPNVKSGSDGEIEITGAGLDLLQTIGFKVRPVLRALVTARDAKSRKPAAPRTRTKWAKKTP